MTIKIKYTVKYYPRATRKVAETLFLFSAVVLFLLGLVLAPTESLPLELKLLVYLLLSDIFYDLLNVSVIILAVGWGLWLFRWRSGLLALTSEKLTIEGSKDVSIWLKNMWEVDIRNLYGNRWIVRLDSNVYAVQIKFKDKNEFTHFVELLVDHVNSFDNERLRILQ